MKFMHPNGTRLALLSGHIRVLPPGEWVELHERFHAAALEARCVVEGTVRAPESVPTPPSPQAVVPLDETAAIRRVLIAMIERNAEDDFTSSNMPNLNTVRRDCGFPIEKSHVFQVFNALRLEAGMPSATAGAETA
jgi:hypothetical protein